MKSTENGVTLLDVTLRDGGYVNGHAWTRADAAAVVAACVDARITYCEVGYFRPRRHESDGERLPAACCPPDYLAELRGRHSDITLVAMCHARDVNLNDYRMLTEMGVGLVRMPATMSLLPSLGKNVAAAKDAGLRVTINLIRVSEVALKDVVRAAELAEEFGADIFYVADSNGSMFPTDVRRIVAAASEVISIPLGFHAHDGLSLAFINSLTALEVGVRYLDASLAGMGKGGGNLSLELIVGYLRARTSAELSMAPLAHAAATVLQPWKGGVMARCESMASGLLDLNLDAIDALRGDEAKELVLLVDSLSG